MKVYLVDGTYELFRAHFGAPPKTSRDGQPVGATLGLLKSMLALLTGTGATTVAVAFDHVIESFRNDLYPGYKTGAGVDPALLAQFSLAEEVTAALGLVVWPEVTFEADDALASAALRFKQDERVEQILLCSPDKDLAQVVLGERIVCWDRRRNITLDAAGVMAKFGVSPQSIPDWLALVGDSADGFPGVPGWGAKSAATVLARFGHLESIPADPQGWGMGAARGKRLFESLSQHWKDALLYRQLATLREDVPISETLEDLEWQGAYPKLRDLCHQLGDDQLPERISRWR